MQPYQDKPPTIVVTAYLRMCLWRASQLHVSDDQLARFAELAGCRFEAERTTLNRFANGHTTTFGTETDTQQLYKFFTTTQLGRAIANFEPPNNDPHTSRDSIVDSGIQKHDALVDRRRAQATASFDALSRPKTKLARKFGVFPNLAADLVNERTAVATLFEGILSRAVAAIEENLIGNYFGYHPGLAPGSGLLQYSVRAFRIGRGPGGLLWFEDYLAEPRPGGSVEVFHNVGVVFYFSDRPQFISIDVGGRRNIRFFMPSQTNVVGKDIEQLTGPMTSWTRTKVPANRYQRLVRVTDLDFERMKLQTCKKPLDDLPDRHADECRALRAIESAAVADISIATKADRAVTPEFQVDEGSPAGSQDRADQKGRSRHLGRSPSTEKRSTSHPQIDRSSQKAAARGKVPAARTRNQVQTRLDEAEMTRAPPLPQHVGEATRKKTVRPKAAKAISRKKRHPKGNSPK